MHSTNDSIYQRSSGPLLQYLVREPKISSNKPPVIFLLHGIGSNEEDLFALAEFLPDKFLVVSLRAPFPYGTNQYAWYQMDFTDGKTIINKKQASKSRNILLQFINQFQLEHMYDESQVYLGGFSQGAIMAYSLGLTRPDLIKGIAVMSGRILEEITSFIASDEELKSLQVFISHGTSDTVLSVQYAREGLEYLKTRGLNPTYKEYDEGHTINREMLADLVSWLNSK